MGGGDGGGGGGGVVEVIKSKGCSRLLVGLSPPLNSFKGLQPVKPMSPAASSSVASDRLAVRSGAPFLGLVICVTGLSKGLTFFKFYFLVMVVGVDIKQVIFIFIFIGIINEVMMLYDILNRSLVICYLHV